MIVRGSCLMPSFSSRRSRYVVHQIIGRLPPGLGNSNPPRNSCTIVRMVVETDGVTLHLAIGRNAGGVGRSEEVMRQLLAAWLVVDERDAPMNPRLIGKPGVGKTRSPMPRPAAGARGLRHAGDRGHAARGPDRAAGDRRPALAALRGLAIVSAMLRGGVRFSTRATACRKKAGPAWRRCSTPRYVESLVQASKSRRFPTSAWSPR